ncbi:MAG: hypothetical protein J6J00_01785 [Treponema sp.]|nr:hypothetical protein [Treponema sp.]
MSKKVFLVFLALGIFLFASCSMDMDYMIKDYNSLFTVESDTIEYTIENVPSDKMLGEKYAVSYFTTLCLAAPSGGVSYKWTAEVQENANNLEEGEVLNLASTRALSLYLRTSSIERWGAYKLTLYVTTSSGEILSDSAMLYVY